MTLDQDDDLYTHCDIVMNVMADGYLIPFFGAGVNLANRPPNASYTPGKYLPDGKELTKIIAEQFHYPWEEEDEEKNLLRVSWHAAIDGPRRLYRHLHRIFSNPGPPTDVHKFFAQLPAKLSAKGYKNCYQLIVTTNYDDLLERAFEDEGEPYDLLSYIALSDDKVEEGKFRYLPHGGKPEIIYTPNDFTNLPVGNANTLDRTIILKIHGAVDKAGWKQSSFVITEDDYLDYLARMKSNDHIPALLMDKMKDSSFLFLGYSLGDWNLRVLFNSIWEDQTFGDTSWAVMHETKAWDEAYWLKHNVRFRQISLLDYIAALDKQLKDLPDISKGGSDE